MEPMPLADLATVVAATLPTGADPAGLVGPAVIIDSRLAEPGCLFVALPGERTDGHDFVAVAVEAGAAASLVTHPVTGGGVQLVVDDPQAALTRLAHHLVSQARDRLQVIGLTGSSGKTTTKDILAQVLAADGPTVAPTGSWNNELGVPLTATRIDHTTRYLVIEMGARGPGHIQTLCDIVEPGIGLVLNVGQAHLGEFGDQQTTAQAKGELIAALPTAGWAVLNADDPWVAGMAERHQGPVAWFSAVGEPPRSAGQVAVWASAVTADDRQQHSFTLHLTDTVVGRVDLQLPGQHQVANAVAAAAAAIVAGVEPATVVAALSQAQRQSPWRLEITPRADGLLVINDAYNANPDSMRAALATAAGLLASRRPEQPKARLVAVLGDMLELGPAAADAHQTVGRQAVASGVTDLIAVGQYAPDLIAGATAAATEAAVELTTERAEDWSAAVSYLGQLTPADIVLVKASRGVGLEAVAQSVLAAKDETC
ncbi:MAG: UDP-N-acetylmuramoyl-tripeptide--D-alanyl-D-alanine ligase [Propionibacteriaceae bacterium]|jgi:UDP-N-acetylmuramoyl-tripeptide--D-alanyl-D-alanine ligase|nr:UDP-N-acetylmuramoyl-tripeptide--D-alanyl-D-alanine ligase [Propionibacteriaceae bacterium]